MPSSGKFTDKHDVVKRPSTSSGYEENDVENDKMIIHKHQTESKDTCKLHSSGKFTDKYDAGKRPPQASVSGYEDQYERPFSELKDKKISEAELSPLHKPRRTSGVAKRPSTATGLEYYEKYKTNVEEEFHHLHIPRGTSGVARRPATATGIEYYEKFLDIKFRSSELENKFATLRENVTKNWIFVKENSSPFAWLKRFKEHNWLAMSVINDRDITKMKIERRDLAEFFLIKALKKGTCKTLNDIEFLESIFLRDIELNSKQRKKKVSESASCDVKHDEFFIQPNNQAEFERCLNRQDVISIKDHLLQESIITFEENEEFVHDKNYYERNKKHLFSQVVKKAVENSDKRSVQCLNHHIENIICKKSSGKKLLQKVMEKPVDKIQTAIKSSSIIVQEVDREEFAKDTGQHDALSLRIKIVNQEQNDLTSFYNQIQENPEATNTSMAQFGVYCDGVETGSVVLHFHPLDRNRKFKFDDDFEDLIQTLLKEADIGNTIPSGEYTLTAEVNVMQSRNKTDSEFLPLTDNINFVAADNSFLENEIDTDAILEGFQIRQRTIEDINPFDDRKTNAKKILKAIMDDNLEDEFICILRENSMTLILDRYEKYMTVYSLDTAGLRRTIIRQFSRIIRDIQIDEVLEVVLDLHIIDESELNELVSKFENRKDIAMATLILSFLKSGNAIHAFAYALYLQEYNPLVETVLSETQQKCDPDFENGTRCYPESRGQSLLFKGCFNVICRKEETEKVSMHVLDEPTSGSGMGISATIFCNDCTVGMDGDTSITSTHMDHCEDRKRYCIVAYVFLVKVTSMIKQKLRSNYERKGFRSLHDFIDCGHIKHTLFHLRHRQSWCCVDTKTCVSGTELPLTYKQWDSLYKKNQDAGSHHCHCNFTANEVQMDAIDFNLASLILLKCCIIAPEEEMLISNLQQFQDNYLRHNVDGLITQTEFITLWKDLTAYVDELDPSEKNEMMGIEEATRDVTLHERYVTLFVASEINKMTLEQFPEFVEACQRQLLQ